MSRDRVFSHRAADVGRRRVHRAALLFFSLLSTVACWVSIDACGFAEEAAEPPLRFRRIFAPADAIGQWPVGNQHYLPIEPAEFDRLVESVRALPSGSTTSIVARLLSARYSARLDGDVLSAGQASLLRPRELVIDKHHRHARRIQQGRGDRSTVPGLAVHPYLAAGKLADPGRKLVQRDVHRPVDMGLRPLAVPAHVEYHGATVPGPLQPGEVRDTERR